MGWRVVLSATVALASFSHAVPAAADEPQLASLPMETLYASGRYDEIVRGAEAAPSADSLAIAARAVLSEAICLEVDPPTSKLKKAEAFARSALTLDPKHIEGRLQLAISLSLQARTMSLGEARRSGYGELTRDLARSVLADDPTNPYAHSFLAIWNLEVRRRGGAMGASIMGASLKDAFWHYEQAAEHAPDDAAIHWQFARALTALNPKKYDGWIDLALARAMNSEANSMAEETMQSRASELLALKGTTKRKSLKKWAAAKL